jgi:hypothetical protein
MSYSIPPYIAAAGIEDSELRYEWDDTKPKNYYIYGSDEVLERLKGVTLRAKIAAAIGIYEWIIWRFHSLSDDAIPFQVAEASWCACIHPSYMRYFELDRKKWLGPVRGPLWCAITILSSMIFFCDEEEEPAARVAFLSSLAIHVLSERQQFENWRNICVDRFLALYAAKREDPFDNLFDPERERGPLISREVLDPNFDYKPELAKESLARFLRGVDYRQNPFLQSPEEMKNENFKGTPYVFEPELHPEM